MPETLVAPPVIPEAAAQVTAEAERIVAQAAQNVHTGEASAQAAPVFTEAPVDAAAPAAEQSGSLLGRMARKVGAVAVKLYETTQVSAGMALTGTREPRAPKAQPAAAPAAKTGAWEKIGTIADKTANFLKRGALISAVGGIAFKALASHHGFDAGGNGGHNNYVPVADTTPLAESNRTSGEIAALKLGVGAVVLLGAIPGVNAWYKYNKRKAMSRRDEEVTLTHPGPGGLSQQDVIRRRAELANDRADQRMTTSRTGPLVPEGTVPGVTVPDVLRYGKNLRQRDIPVAKRRASTKWRDYK